MRVVVPSITTHGRSGSDWRSKLLEVEHLGLNQIGLFVTGLNPQERQLCFHELVKLRNRFEFSIPFVHAVASMKEVEFRFLRDCFGTKKFNLHPVKEYPLEFKLSDSIREHILIENASACVALNDVDVEAFGGICIDISHLEDMRINHPAEYEKTLSLLSKYPVNANHVSAVAKNVVANSGCCLHRSIHIANADEDFEYLKSHPAQVFSNIAALELENSIHEQVQYLSAVSHLFDMQTDAVKQAVAA